MFLCGNVAIFGHFQRSRGGCSSYVQYRNGPVFGYFQHSVPYADTPGVAGHQEREFLKSPPMSLQTLNQPLCPLGRF